MRVFLAIFSIIAAPFSALCEVAASGPDHYRLRHEAIAPVGPEALWARLTEPKLWWNPDHTYSGDASNLSLTLEAGGHWREDWSGKTVLHGRVLYADGRILRLDAPFGPLQSMAVTVVWTITLEPHEEGTKVIFDEVANGSSASGLDAVAGAVDAVKQQAIERLVAIEP